MGIISNFLKNISNFDVALEYSELVNNHLDAVKRWVCGFEFVGNCIPTEDKAALDKHKDGYWERSKHLHQWFDVNNATYEEKEYIVRHKGEIISINAIFMKYYPTLKELQNLRNKYQLGFDNISKKYANVIVVENKKQGLERHFVPNRRLHVQLHQPFAYLETNRIYEVLSIAYMTLEERSSILAHKNEIAMEDIAQRQKQAAADAKTQKLIETKQIEKACSIRKFYPNGYKFYVCGSLETDMTLEYAQKTIEKEDLIKQKEREFLMNSNVSSEEFSTLKFGSISFKKWRKIASSDIRTYKEVQAKLPNRYNGHQEGKKRSFLGPDCFKSYEIGSVEQSELTLCKHTVEYDYETKEDYHKYEIIGIPSYVERQPCRYVQWYKVFSCECVIPKGAEYYEGYKDGKLVCFLSDKIEIRQILETCSSSHGHIR